MLRHLKYLILASLFATPAWAQNIESLPSLTSTSAPTNFQQQNIRGDCTNATPTSGICWPVVELYNQSGILSATNGIPASMNISGTATVMTGTTNGLQVDPTAAFADTTPATQTITAHDAASTSATWANGQVAVSGSPTASSAASFTFATKQTVAVMVSGTWAGTVVTEESDDGGTTWFSKGVYQDGISTSSSSFTSPSSGVTGNFNGCVNAGAKTAFRVRSTAWTSGTATVKVNESVGSICTVHVANLSSPPVSLAQCNSGVNAFNVQCGTAATTGTARVLWTASVRSSSAGVYLAAFNSTTNPASGSVTAGTAAGNVEKCWGPGSNLAINYQGGPGLQFSSGVWLVVSSTDPCQTGTYTPTGSINQIDGQVQ